MIIIITIIIIIIIIKQLMAQLLSVKINYESQLRKCDYDQMCLLTMGGTLP